VHVDKNGLEYMVDGGSVYARRNVHESAPYEELSVSLNDPIERIREVFEWGTFGINGDQPRKNIKLKDMSDDHITAIIEKHDGFGWGDLWSRELEYRKGL